MNFCWVTLRVADFEKSLEFYHGLLGLGVCDRHGANGTEIAMLGEKDLPKIELLFIPGAKERPLSSDISIGLAVESLDETMDYLKAKGVSIIRGPISPNPHVRFAFILDPDGYEVQLVESSRH